MRIGDRVAGKFRAIGETIDFLGIIEGGDWGGGLYIRFETTVEFRPGDARKDAYFDAREREIADIRVLEAQVEPCIESKTFQGHIIRVR